MANQNHTTEDAAIPVLDDMVLLDSPNLNQRQEPQLEESVALAKPIVATPVPSLHMDFTSSKPLPRNNPFLPYEHLEQLAKERAEFQKQFLQLAETSMKSAATWTSPKATSQASTPYQTASRNLANDKAINKYAVNDNAASYRVASEPAGYTSGFIDNLARQLTQEVVSELRPQIEKRIRELLDERLAAGSTSPEAISRSSKALK